MLPFTIDKAENVLVEGLAEEFIRQYYLNRGLKVSVYENEAQWYEGKKTHDRRVSTGDLWEIKNDEKAWHTGNVFLEREAFEHSKATHHLRFAQGQAFAHTREQIAALMADSRFTDHCGGDWNKAFGPTPPVEVFAAAGERVILSRYVL